MSSTADSRHRLRAWLARPETPAYLAIALGIFIRAAHVLVADFPLSDGGMFYAMAKDVRAAHNTLPAVTSYNGAGIPFAYSPIGFFLAAALNTLGVPMLALFRFVPLLAASLLVVAFYHLARTMLRERTAVTAAVVAFAVVPRGFAWLIMGGGLTRSLGLLFAVVALHQMLLFYTGGSWRHAATAAVACAFTVMSHMGVAAWLVWSMGLFLVFYGRSRKGLLGAVAVGAATVVLTAPWWATILATHGPGPFAAARASSGSIFDAEGRYATVLGGLDAFYTSTAEPFFPLVGVLGILGALTALRPGRLVFVAWWVLTFVADARAGGTFASVPVSMLAGLGLTQLLLPALRTYYTSGWRRHVPGFLLGMMIVYATFAALWHKDFGSGDPRILVPLSRGHRETMRWVAEHTPRDARFAVVTGQTWSSDKVAEWFPALAGRRSITTLQGREWFPGFVKRQKATDAFQAQCPDVGLTCLTAFADSLHESFNYVYVEKDGGTRMCCAALVETLRHDPTLALIYESPDAAVFERRQTAVAFSQTSRAAVALRGLPRR